MGFSIIVKDKNNETKAEHSGLNQAVLAWKGVYEEGDRSFLRFLRPADSM